MAEATTEDKPKRRRAPRKAKAEKAEKPATRGRRSKNAVPTGTKLDVRFMKLSANENEAGMQIAVPRHQLSLAQAESLLMKRRLHCRIGLHPDGDDEDQQYLFEGMKTELKTILDTNELAVSPQVFKTRITFATDDLNPADILRLSQKEGTLLIESSASQDGDGDE